MPVPTRDYDDMIDRAALIWIDPRNPKNSVALTVYPLDGGATPEKTIGVEIDGAPGYLHRGSVGEHVAWWDLDARCNFLELSVSLQAVAPAATDRQVVKVARSLR